MNAIGDYIPSGQWTARSIITCILLGLPLSILLSYLHSLTITEIDNLIFSGIMLVIAIVAVAFIPGYLTINIGKNRSPKLAKILGLLCALIYLYFHWCFWIDMIMRSSNHIVLVEAAATYASTYKQAILPYIILDPIGLIKLIIHSDVWLDNSAGSDWYPMVLRFLWFLEALIFLYVTPYNFAKHTKRPFCEETNSWFKSHFLESLTGVENKEQFREKLLNGDFSPLFIMTFKPRDYSHIKSSDIHEYYDFEIMYSEDKYYLNINVRISKRQVGGVKTSELEIVKNLELPKEIGSKLLTIQVGQSPKDVFFPNINSN